jgi:Spy/CpxP family protein refolding chaperone
MNKFTRSAIISLFFLTVTVAGGVHNSSAADNSSVKAGPAKTPGTVTPVEVSDSQKTQLRDVYLKYQAAIKPVMKQYGEELKSLEELIHAEKVDDAAIRAQVAKVSMTGADLAVSRARFIHDLRSVLKQEQAQKFHQSESEKANAKMDSFLLQLAGSGKQK